MTTLVPAKTEEETAVLDQTPPVEDNFADAFAKFAEPSDAVTTTETPVPAEAPAAVVPAADEGDGDDGAPAGDEGGEEAPAAAGPTPDALARIADMLAQREPPPAQQAAPLVQPPAPYSDEEVQSLSQYQKDWPDIARNETLRRREEYKQLVGYVFAEVSKEVAPLLAMVNELKTRTHLSDLEQAVPDYDTTREGVIKWATEQPAYLRAAYQHVIERGTVDEVADLITRYKAANGITDAAAPAGSPAPAAAAAKQTELPPAAKKAVASLAPVGSKRSNTTVAGAIDTGDFEGAFGRFAEMLDKI